MDRFSENDRLPEIDRLTEAEMSEQASLRVRGLSKRFAATAPPALDRVDLNIPAGSIHGVLGLSGAGKSTLLRCIARLETPDAGSIFVAGKDWAALTPGELRRERGKMGIVFQQLYLLASRTVAANIALPLELHRAPQRSIGPRIDELLDWFGIADKANSYPAQLSGGQKQRVALARALATSPRILLADEPTSALDPETRASVLNTLSSIRRQLGVTILIITHDLHSVASICDALTVLDAGCVVESGSTAQVLERPKAAVTRRLLGRANTSHVYTADAASRDSRSSHLSNLEVLGQP
jgi:D-methionine transport system ATP-binding protein